MFVLRLHDRWPNTFTHLVIEPSIVGKGLQMAFIRLVRDYSTAENRQPLADLTPIIQCDVPACLWVLDTLLSDVVHLGLDSLPNRSKGFSRSHTVAGQFHRLSRGIYLKADVRLGPSWSGRLSTYLFGTMLSPFQPKSHLIATASELV